MVSCSKSNGWLKRDEINIVQLVMWFILNVLIFTGTQTFNGVLYLQENIGILICCIKTKICTFTVYMNCDLSVVEEMLPRCL